MKGKNFMRKPRLADKRAARWRCDKKESRNDPSSGDERAVAFPFRSAEEEEEVQLQKLSLPPAFTPILTKSCHSWIEADFGQYKNP